MFFPEDANRSENAPALRYFALRETVDIPCEREDDGQLAFLTSDFAAGKPRLEKMDDKVYKAFGLVTNKSGSPVDILLWRRGRSEKEHSSVSFQARVSMSVV